MADVRGVAVPENVRGPLVLGRVGVAGTDVAGLKGFEVLKSAEFVGHFVSELFGRDVRPYFVAAVMILNWRLKTAGVM